MRVTISSSVEIFRDMSIRYFTVKEEEYKTELVWFNDKLSRLVFKSVGLYYTYSAIEQ